MDTIFFLILHISRSLLYKLYLFFYFIFVYAKCDLIAIIVTC
jgi:hypothetical protein